MRCVQLISDKVMTTKDIAPVWEDPDDAPDLSEPLWRDAIERARAERERQKKKSDDGADGGGRTRTGSPEGF